jgi:AraC family transcriptional regulator, ethanolamine operon transcriptional activator
MSMPPSNPAHSAGLILQHRFTDIDQFAAGIQPISKVRLTQLRMQGLQCDLRLAAFDEVQFAFIKSSCPILAVGEKPRDFITFACLLEVTGPGLIAHRRKLSHSTLGGIDPNREAEFVLPSDMQFLVFQIKRSILQNCLEVMEREDLNERFWANNFVQLPETILSVKAYLWQLLHLIEHQPQFLQQPQFKKLLLEDFIPLLINAIPPATPNRLTSPPLLTRAELVKRAEDYMLAHLDQSLTLTQLCQALYVSKRSLFYGFEEMFGVSPMAYLKIQRLQTVRRSLAVAAPDTVSVTSIARQFGFWSPGHFARDYKTMFGELPSETLRRTVPSCLSVKGQET